MKLTLWFKEITINDVLLVGGKNAALGEMYQKLTPLGVRIPNGFTVTAEAYDYFIEFNNLKEKIQDILTKTDIYQLESLQKAGSEIRNLIQQGNFPKDLLEEILQKFQDLANEYGGELEVAVRSSATAEDLPDASFAGQQETFLNVKQEQLLEKIKACFASLFTDRAIFYREEKGFDHFQVKLSVGVQKMVRSDLASSGVMFTLDPDTGLDKVIVINGIFGLGELIVQGRVIPDEFIVFKEGLQKGFPAIISKRLGQKDQKIVYAEEGIQTVTTTSKEKESFSLTEEEVLELAKFGLLIEEHFQRAMDIEWAKDGKENKLYIVQARPETVYSTKKKRSYQEYRLKEKGKPILTGFAIGNKITNGKVRVIKDVAKINEFQEGEILVTEMTDPDWVPIMKKAKGIITNKGGRTCHAAIISRELGISCIVSTQKATEILQTGQEITIDCSQGITGYVYDGILDYEVIDHDLEKIPETKTKVMVNIGTPEEAWQNYWLPVNGVGLAREEFIIAEEIKIHPLALLNYPNLPEDVKAKVEELTKDFSDKKEFYIQKLAEGIAKIATAFYPYEILLRFSDFKSNEYRNLIGGNLYEPEESNPMLGFRGASRYYHSKFQLAFELEILAVKKAIFDWGLDNLSLLIPFCRTIEEGQKVVSIIKQFIPREKVKIYLMCEIPSNVLLAEEFLEIFDGFSIGSNDLAQLTLGIDRDSALVGKIANETNEAVKKLMKHAIEIAKEKNKYSGICGQAPSDFPELIEFLVKAGIKSISFNSDSVIKGIEKIKQIESSLNEN